MINPARNQFHEPLRIRPASQKKDEPAFNGVLTNKILSALPGGEFAHLLPYLEPTSFRTGQFLYELGQDILFVYFPETVVISQLYYLEDGSSASVSIIGNDGMLGLTSILNNQKTNYWALATIGGTTLRMRIDDAKREFAKAGPFQNRVLCYANERMAQLAQRAVCSTRHKLEERLCSWLLMIDDRVQGSELPLTHEAISQHLGTRRAGVTNFCNVLRDHQVITYHRGMITILNRVTLEESACECYRRMQNISGNGR